MFKKRLPLLLTFLAGTLPIFSFLFRTPSVPALGGDPEANGIKQISDTFETWMVILFAGALLLGVVNVFQVNLKKISNRAKGWIYSVVFLSALLITAFFGLFDVGRAVYVNSVLSQAAREGARLGSTEAVWVAVPNAGCVSSRSAITSSNPGAHV